MQPVTLFFPAYHVCWSACWCGHPPPLPGFSTSLSLFSSDIYILPIYNLNTSLSSRSPYPPSLPSFLDLVPTGLGWKHGSHMPCPLHSQAVLSYPCPLLFPHCSPSSLADPLPPHKTVNTYSNLPSSFWKPLAITWHICYYFANFNHKSYMINNVYSL